MQEEGLNVTLEDVVSASPDHTNPEMLHFRQYPCVQQTDAAFFDSKLGPDWLFTGSFALYTCFAEHLSA